MAKKKMIYKTIDTACVVGVDLNYSTKNFENYYDIEMVDPISGKYIRTYISKNNHNFKNWKDIIDTFRMYNGKKAIVLEGNIHLKDEKLVNADSRPQITNEVNLKEFLNVYADTFLK